MSPGNRAIDKILEEYRKQELMAKPIKTLGPSVEVKEEICLPYRKLATMPPEPPKPPPSLGELVNVHERNLMDSYQIVIAEEHPFRQYNLELIRSVVRNKLIPQTFHKELLYQTEEQPFTPTFKIYLRGTKENWINAWISNDVFYAEYKDMLHILEAELGGSIKFFEFSPPIPEVFKSLWNRQYLFKVKICGFVTATYMDKLRQKASSLKLKMQAKENGILLLG